MVLGPLGRIGTVFRWEGSEGNDPLQQPGCSNPPSPAPTSHALGNTGTLTSHQKHLHLPQQQPDVKKKRNKKKNKADKAQAAERQSVLFLIQQSYLISALAFQFPDYPADTSCSCSAWRSHRPTAPKLGLQPRSFMSLHI